MLAAALIAHAGAAAALLIVLSPALRPALLAAPHPAHALALERGLRWLLFAYALTPRLTAIPMALVARRAARSRWFGAGAAVVAAESVFRAAAALVAPHQMTPTLWITRLRPPAHAYSAAVTLALTGWCWTMALAGERAAERGSAQGADVWDVHGAAATMCWTLALTLGIAHIVAPFAVAFVLRLG